MSERTTRSPEEWRAILLEFEQSEGPVGEFIEKHSIVGSMLYGARKRFGLKYDRGDKRNIERLQADPSAPVPRKSGYNHPPELREKAIELYKQGGKNAAQIAKELGIPKKAPAVQYWIHQHNKQAGSSGQKAANGSGENAKAAISLLRQAEKELMRLIRQNKIQNPDGAHLLAQMALRVLTGDQ